MLSKCACPIQFRSVFFLRSFSLFWSYIYLSYTQHFFICSFYFFASALLCAMRWVLSLLYIFVISCLVCLCLRNAFVRLSCVLFLLTFFLVRGEIFFFCFHAVFVIFFYFSLGINGTILSYRVNTYIFYFCF